MIEYRKANPDENIPYGRPSISSWIAAAAVALAVFMMGGFIKTYRQLETLKVETKREIQELRQIVDRMRQSGGQGAPVRRAAAARDAFGSHRLSPESRRDGRERRRPVASPSAGATDDELALIPEIADERRGITYEFGRKSARAAAASAGGAEARTLRQSCQVISTDNHQKRVMIEGGRNKGLDRGSRLELSRDGRWIADLRVTDVFDNMSACEVLHSTLAPEPGDVVRNVEPKL